MSHGRRIRRGRAARRGSRGKRRLPGRTLPFPAIAIIGLALHLTSGGSAAPAVADMPSAILCSGWLECASQGFDSYGYGTSGDASYWDMSAGDECTNYVAYVESTVFGAPTPGYLLGNAGQWPASAQAHGVVVNDVPAVGAVAEWNGGSFGVGPLGHVAVVEKVGPHDSYIDISQQHLPYDADGYDWTRINAGFSADEWEEWPDNFIHFPIKGYAAVGYYNSQRGSFDLRDSLSGGTANFSFRLGPPGMVPVVGNWTGRAAGAGYYNPRTGWFHLRDALARGRPAAAFRFGPPGMIPLTGNWDGRGGDGVGYYDPRTGTFHLRNHLSSGPADYTFGFGPPGMIPLTGDWDGRGRDGVGYYNPRTATFYLRNQISSGKPDYVFTFGTPGMVPVAGNWNGGPADGVGYYNPRTGWFGLRGSLLHGPADYTFRFGPRGMAPLAGDWLG
jgi:surface antigen